VEQLVLTYSRSTGPGGQHVNTTNTKVDLRFNVKEASWLTEEQKLKLLAEVSRDSFNIFLMGKSPYDVKGL